MDDQKKNKSALDGTIPDVGPERTMEGDGKGLNSCCKFNEFLFIGSAEDGTLRVFHLPTHKERKRFSIGFKGMYESGTHLFVVQADARILVFSMSMKLPVAYLNGHEKWITGMCISLDVGVTSAADGTACVWDLGNYVPKKRKGALMTSDSKKTRAMVNKYDRTTSDVETDTTFGGDESVGELSDEDLLSFGEEEEPDTFLEKLARHKTVTPVRRLNDHTDIVTSCAIVVTFLVTTSADLTVRLWNLAGKCVQVAKGSHEDWITHSVAVNTTVVTASKDNMVVMWRLTLKKGGLRGKDQYQLKKIKASQTQARPSKLFVCNKKVFVATSDNAFHLMNQAGQFVKSFHGHEGKITAIHSSRDTMSFLWTSSEDKRMRKWALETGNTLTCYVGHKKAITGIYMVQGELLTTSLDGTIMVWSRRIEADKLRWYQSNKAMSKQEEENKLSWYHSDSPQSTPKGGKKSKKGKGKEPKGSGTPKKAEDEFAWYM